MSQTMTVSEVREIYPRPEGAAVQKRWRKLDRFMRAFIKRSPFLCLGTANAAGKADVSPRGDPPGFVQILDDETLLIPDRPGNNHLDSIENIIANPNVGLIFFVPGSEETLRVNGRARVVDDPSLLAAAELNGRAPKAGIEVSIGEVFLHCPKALKRSRLWDPSQHADRASFPSPGDLVAQRRDRSPKFRRLLEQLHHQALELGRRRRVDVRRRRNFPIESENADSTIFPSPQESINRTYPKASARLDFCPYYRTTAPLAQPTPQAEDRFLASRPFIGPIQKGSKGSI
jgi:PPOX class probable FMN-dependent enzyme